MNIIFRLGTLLMFMLSVVLILTPNTSLAWSCSESLEPNQLLKRHDSVFIGKAIALSYENVGALNPKSRVTFEVESSLKGNSEDKTTVVTTIGSEFLEGTKYLVYAYKTTKDNYLYKYAEGELATDTMCGGTKELSLAAYDLEQIAEGKSSNMMVHFVIISMIVLVVFTGWRYKCNVNRSGS